MFRLVIVTKKTSFFNSILSQYNFDYLIFDNKNELENYIPRLTSKDILISYSHNILFQNDILSRIKIGYNIHAASPEFPGRDPHHWAIYAGVKKYGAVLHIIEKKVDSGAIIDAIYFDVKSSDGPMDLLESADNEAKKLIVKLIDKISKNEKIEVNKSFEWGLKKRSRKDFIDMCEIPHHISNEELSLRIRAFHVEGRKNLYTIIRDHKFYF